MSVVYYNFTTKHEILDITGVKRKVKLAKEFGNIAGYKKKKFNEKTQGYRFESNQIVLYDIQAEKAANENTKRLRRRAARIRLRQKYGFTKEDFRDLRLALRRHVED